MNVINKPDLNLAYQHGQSEAVLLEWNNISLKYDDENNNTLTFDTPYYIDLTKKGNDYIILSSETLDSDYFFVDSLKYNAQNNYYTYTCTNTVYRLLKNNEFYKVYVDRVNRIALEDILNFTGLTYNGTWNGIQNSLTAIFDGQSGLEIIYGMLYNCDRPHRMVFLKDSIKFIPMDNWHSDYFFVPEMLLTEDISFDVGSIITDVLAIPAHNPLATTSTKGISDSTGVETAYTSEKIYGIKLSEYFPLYQKVIGTLSTSGIETGANISGFGADGRTNMQQEVIGIGHPSTGCGGSWSDCQINTFDNICPRCGRKGHLVFHSSYYTIPNKYNGIDGEITCYVPNGGCGADYSVDGQEKSGACNDTWKLKPKTTSKLDCSQVATEQQKLANGDYVTKGTDAKAATDSSPAEPAKPPQKENVNSDIETELRTALNTIGDSLNKLLSITISLPGTNSEIKPNMFINVTLTPNFTLDGLETILQKISAKYPYKDEITFYNNWYFCHEKTVTVSLDEFKTELTLIPLPPSHNQYRKLLLKARDNYINAKSGVENTGDTPIGSVAFGDEKLNRRFQELAAKYGSICNTAYTSGCNSGYDCWCMSKTLCDALNNSGFNARVVQYDYSAKGGASNHRSVQVHVGGQWVDFPYRDLKFNEGFNNYKERNQANDIVLSNCGGGC